VHDRDEIINIGIADLFGEGLHIAIEST
jgi:hypothetical protein